MRHRPKILLVDDQPEGLELLMTFLSPADYDHISASGGLDCLEKARSLDPDLVLLDIRLPDLDGYEVCRRLRRDPALAEIPVILITAYDEPEARRKGLEAGADDFITKPFDPTELAARVRSITRLNRYRRLLAERERFHWAVDHCEEGFLILNGNDEVIEANSQGRRLLGLAEEGKIAGGINFLQTVQGRYRLEPEAAWAGWPEGAGGDSTRRYLIRPQNPSSPGVWLEAETLKQESGETVNYVVRLRDVTEKRKSVSRIRSFEAAISQKLRNRLLLTVSGINTLSAPRSAFQPEEFQEILGEVGSNARLLERELLEILRYLDTPDLLFSGPPFPFRELEGLLAQIGESLGINPPAVEIEQQLAGAETPISALAMETILWELLTNAVKFHPARLPAVAAALESKGEKTVILRLSDNGSTLSPEEIRRAWTPYYQGRDPEETEGLGLGLPTVAAYVWHWGGYCRIFNRTDGPGVAVELTLPRF
ncbi:MAG: response regulator [Candidatus Erginobacter occultus]|nr:response regulator [Candidatus Erginobacter occultus]